MHSITVVATTVLCLVLTLAGSCQAQSNHSRRNSAFAVPTVLGIVFSILFAFMWIFLCIFIRKRIKKHRHHHTQHEPAAQSQTETPYIHINQTDINTGVQSNTAGGQPSLSTVTNSNEFQPTAPPPQVLTQQIETQLPHAGLYQGEAPPKYKDTIH